MVGIDVGMQKLVGKLSFPGANINSLWKTVMKQCFCLFILCFSLTCSFFKIVFFLNLFIFVGFPEVNPRDRFLVSTH